MVPDMNEKTPMVATSQPPQRSIPARSRSVRGRRPAMTSPTTSATSAAGMNQEIWVPNADSNIRSRPADPPKLVLPPPPNPPPPLPDPPSSRLSPL